LGAGEFDVGTGRVWGVSGGRRDGSRRGLHSYERGNVENSVKTARDFILGDLKQDETTNEGLH